MAVELRIAGDKNGTLRNFIFESGEIKILEIPQDANSATLSAPKDSASDTTEDFVLSLGVSKEMTITWKLYNQTTDRSEGTAPSAIQTYEEMLNYLEDIICYPGIGTIDYTITFTDKFRTRTGVYSFESLNIDTDAKLHPTGIMKFKLKRQVGADSW